MFEERKDEVALNEPCSFSATEEASTALTLPEYIDLNEESRALIEQIILEKDEQKSRDLTQLFNANQNKKTMVRVNKLSDLLDTITDQALVRFSSRPDEISNKELFDGLKVVQDLIERGQKQVSGAGETPLIQVNQQTNEVNIGGTVSSLNRDSRERVKSAVLNILNSINTVAPIESTTDDIVTIDADAITEDEGFYNES
jgi:hypothetical protein